MKINLKKVGSLLALGLLAINAQATVLFQDNFNYPNGTLTNSTWVAGAGNGLNSSIYVTNGNTVFIVGKSSSDLPRAYFTNAPAGTPSSSAAPNFASPAYWFSTNNGVAESIYYSFTLNAATAPANNGFYVAYLADTNFNFRCAIEVTTNHAASGSYRLGILSKSSDTFIQTNLLGVATNVIQQDLTVGQSYFVLARYNTDGGLSALWINPTNEASTATNVIATSTPVSGTVIYGFYDAVAGTTNTATAAVGLRASSTSTSGNLQISNLWVATSYAEAVPAIPQIIQQPQDNTSLFSGSSVSFPALAVANSAISYQWYFTSNSVIKALVNSANISGATSNVLTLSSLATNQSGYYSVVVTTTSGSSTSRLANVSISLLPVAPVISSQPVGATNNTGDNITLSVTATGIPTPVYQWYVVTNGVTNAVTGSAYSGAGTATLIMSSVTTNLAGTYFVTITNAVGKTNSALAVVQINPIATLSIATLRGLVDPTTFAPTNTTSLFTTTGIVTTHTNLSTGGCEFYIQDSSGGICIYWSGAVNTNLPPFGAQVKVVGALAAFNNLLELEVYTSNPLESVSVLSTNNQPVPQTLPFDPNIVGSLATMQKLEGNYFVASNVTLVAGATFVSASLGENITANSSKVAAYSTAAETVNFTNAAGQTFVLYINSYTDIPGQGKPSGPVTIYGVMGNYKNTFEFTPSRYADIISYVHVTNVLTHARKGDLATNTYTELVLRPGETLNTFVSIGDAAGGTVTLTPLTAGLSANSSWSGIASGITAVGNFTFTPTSADAGSNYLVSLAVTSTAGTAYTNTFSVYVPTPDEQQMAITEILANPTTNPAVAFYNPLARNESINPGISTNDQYIEIANQSGTDWNGGSGTLFKLDTGIASSPVFSSFDGSGADLPAGGALVVYGGNSSSSPGIGSTAISRGLLLPTSSSGTVVFRNANGNIVDRVVYAASDLATNGSLKRFPTINDSFVSQAYVGFNPVEPGYQYDGAYWSNPSQIPAGVTNMTIAVVNNNAVLNFPVNGNNQVYTLWSVGNLPDTFKPIFGQPLTGSTASFSVTNLPNQQFYYISTQTNGTPPPSGGS